MKSSAVAFVPLVLALTACNPSQAPAQAEEAAQDAPAASEAVTETAAVARDDEPTFPAEFHGRWDLSVERCGLDESGTALTIDDREIVGYEDTSTLRSFEVLDGGALHVELDLVSPEGEQRIRYVMWRTSQDGEWLDIEGDSRPRSIRYARCEG